MKYKISCENLFSAVLLFVLCTKFSNGSNQAEKEKTGKYFIFIYKMIILCDDNKVL